MVKQHFIFSEIKRVYSKMYGGSTYTLSIYENLGKGRLKYIGEETACTRAHKGEVSEVYTKLQELKVIRPSIMKAIKQSSEAKQVSGNYMSYYNSTFEERFGLMIQGIN